MSLLIYDNAQRHEPIRASRITPSGLNRYGDPDRSSWLCPRCGADVESTGNLVPFAPCADCRYLLREEYGDETTYDARTLARRAAHAAALGEVLPPIIPEPPAEVVDAITVRHLAFPLARVGASLDPEQ